MADLQDSVQEISRGFQEHLMTKPPPIKTTDAQASNRNGTATDGFIITSVVFTSSLLLLPPFRPSSLGSVSNSAAQLSAPAHRRGQDRHSSNYNGAVSCDFWRRGKKKKEGGSKVSRVGCVDVVGFLLLLLLLLSAHPLSLHSLICFLFFLQTQGFLNFLHLGSKRKRETDGQPSFSSLILLFLPPSPPPHVASLRPPDGPEPSGSG